MKYKIVPNFFFVVMAIILGAAIYRQFNFEDLKFENPALSAIYAIVFVSSIGFMIKKSKKE